MSLRFRLNLLLSVTFVTNRVRVLLLDGVIAA
jgi:hypothetical protein